MISCHGGFFNAPHAEFRVFGLVCSVPTATPYETIGGRAGQGRAERRAGQARRSAALPSRMSPRKMSGLYSIKAGHSIPSESSGFKGLGFRAPEQGLMLDSLPDPKD